MLFKERFQVLEGQVAAHAEEIKELKRKHAEEIQKKDAERELVIEKQAQEISTN